MSVFDERDRQTLTALVDELFPHDDGGERDWLRLLLIDACRLADFESFKRFIHAASDPMILTLATLMPRASIGSHIGLDYQHLGDAELLELFEEFPDERPQSLRIVDRLNDWLATTRHPARFKGWTLEPAAQLDVRSLDISSLPGRGRLYDDLRIMITQSDPVAVLFIDLDNFKTVNDRLGHQAGDLCLAKVVTVIASVAIGKGHVYRYGGDEFVVLLFNATSAEGVATAERLRAAVESAHVGAEVSVTASIGVATSHECQRCNAEELVARSDKATYAAKIHRNLVCAWPLDKR